MSEESTVTLGGTVRQKEFETLSRPVRDDNHQRLRFKSLNNIDMLRLRLKTFTWLVFIGLYCLVGMRAALAQIDQGAITGTVTDSTGNAIVGAAVTLLDQETGLSFQRTTNGDGSYRFAPIKIGLYTLTVTAKGFETQKQENIRVDVSQTVGLNLALKPGSVTESVTVTSSPELQTEDASTGQVFTTPNSKTFRFEPQLCVSGPAHHGC